VDSKQGIFVVLEGSDGSGKSTQFRLLTERLKAVGYDVEVFKFPQYDQPSSHFIKKYLNGEYGPAADISPYTASLFYALDRYEAAPDIRKALTQGKLVLADRYVGSNMAHQGSKFTNSGEQRGFFIWEDGLEFQMLGIPRPTINLFLRVPAEVSQQLMQKAGRHNREYTDQTHDEHEKDHEHLRRSVATYDTLCKLFPKDFTAIDCAPDNNLLSIADINDKIWDVIKPILPAKPPHAGHDVVVQFNTKDSAPQKNIDHREETSNIITDDALEVRVKKVSKLATSRVQEIAGINCEILSTEWPDENIYSSYTPSEIPKNLIPTYKQSLEKIANLHKQIRAANTSAIIPMAALNTIKISGNSKAMAELIAHLKASQLGEARWLAEQLQVAAGKTQSQGQTNPSPAKLGDDALFKIIPEEFKQLQPTSRETITLEEALPKNEFSLLVDAIYPYSNLPRADIAAGLEKWTYNQKGEALAAALDNNSPTLEEARYRWDAILSTDLFSELKKIIDVVQLQNQCATPQYGYDIPEEIELAGFDELYIECFSESLALYSSLENAGLGQIAEYALLMGHKNRWQFMTSAKELKAANAKTSFDDIKALIDTMIAKVSEHHPLIGTYLNNETLTIQPPKQKPEQDKPQETKKPSSHRRRRSRKFKK
jgi:dTMP kinase